MIPIDDLKKKIIKIGGVVFEDPYLMNIVMISDLNNADEWNDTIVYFYYDENKSIHQFEVNEFTANPGTKYLKSPINKSGTAIIVEGWYRKLWVLGLHKGEYEALVQNSPISVYRDSNKDGELDPDSSKIETGMFGINLHRANKNSIASSVSLHSAGCCVFRKYSDWTKFMEEVHKCRDKGGQKYWSLALFDKTEFNKN